MAYALEHVAWETCLIEPRPDREIEEYAKRRMGLPNPALRYFGPVPWLARAMVDLHPEYGLLVHLEQEVGNVRPGARKAIERDREQGRRLVLATASYRLYADAIAERLGFDDVIATGSIIGLDERVHARIAGKNCYGEEKMRMIAEWVEKSGLTGAHGHVRFYSDHASDEPAFLWSDEPVAVNPHDRLARMAAERGWAVEDWGA
jgi:HAD superfamily phosphoserine phosphatase-like hydrolase